MPGDFFTRLHGIPKTDRIALVLSGVWLILSWPVVDELISMRLGPSEYLVVGVLPVFIAWGIRWIRGSWLPGEDSPSDE